MNLSKAKEIAIAICQRLQPHCEKVNIAGSVRRKKPEVKDIEIICLPKKVIAGTPDLFGGGSVDFANANFQNEVRSIGKTLKGNSQGKYMQIALPDGINLDLFIPDSFDYYRQYAIRTGSADYSAKVIATRWRVKGWCGSDQGLRRMKDCVEIKQPDGKSKWKCVRNNADKPPHWHSEKEFFDWIGVEMLPPEQRNV